MKKTIKLSENELINVIKKITKTKILLELEKKYTWSPSPNQNKNKNKFTPTTKTTYSNASDANLNNIKQYKRLRLIFPQGKWWEYPLLSVVKSLGLISGVFDSLPSAIKRVNELAAKNVKVDELVIGSHGDGKTLLITSDGNKYHFDTSFLDALKKIIHQNTKVFFTACGGANELDALKTAAEHLGVGVYGASGIYNPVSNSAERGFYWASPKIITKTNKTITPWRVTPTENRPFYDKNIIVKIKGTLSRGGNINVKIKRNTKPINNNSIIIDPPKVEKKLVSKWRTDNTGDLIYTYVIDLHRAPSFENLYPYYKDKNINLTNEIKSGNIIVTINGIDIKNLPTIDEKTIVNNQFLLDNNYCKKINSPPISWI